MNKEQKLIHNILSDIQRLNSTEDRIELQTRELYKLKTGKEHGHKVPYRLALYEMGIGIKR